MSNPSKDEKGMVASPVLQRNRLRLVRLLTFIAIVLIAIGAFYALGQVMQAVYVLIFSLLIVFIFHKPVDWLEGKGLPRSLAIVICLVALLGVLALVVVAVAPSIIKQVTSFVRSLPYTVYDINGVLNDALDTVSAIGAFDTAQISDLLEDVYKEALSMVKSLASMSVTGIVNVSVSVGSGLVVGLFSFVAAFWFLRDYHKIAAEIHIIIGPALDPVAIDVVAICGRSFGGYLLGQLVSSVCTGVIAGVLFSIIGLPYSMAMGFLTGVMNFIPVIGPWIAGIVAALVGLPSGLFVCVGSVVSSIVAQQFTDIFISPRVMSQTAQLHPALVIVSVLAGGSVGGILGMIFAVPLTASAIGVFAYFFERRTGRALVDAHGALFRSVRRRRKMPSLRKRG